MRCNGRARPGQRWRDVVGQQEALQKYRARVNLDAGLMEPPQRAVGDKPLVGNADWNLRDVELQYGGDCRDLMCPVEGRAEPSDEALLLERDQLLYKEVGARLAQVGRLVDEQPMNRGLPQLLERAQKSVAHLQRRGGYRCAARPAAGTS